MRKRSMTWPVILLLLATTGGLAIVGGQDIGGPPPTPMMSPAQATSLPAIQSNSRNLALQPEASKLSRRVGRRFFDQQRSLTIAEGTLKTESGLQAVRITRRQTDRGERVEIQRATDGNILTWNEDEGAKASGTALSRIERLLIERLALDSADQFVLAQLRGASYQTVMRNVRAAGADSSNESRTVVWDIVRVSEPDTEAAKSPLSKWRLYYLSSSTGLIDKVVSEVDGERLETSFAGWADQNGELFPARVTWRHEGQVVMEFRVTSFSYQQASH